MFKSTEERIKKKTNKTCSFNYSGISALNSVIFRFSIHLGKYVHFQLCFAVICSFLSFFLSFWGGEVRRLMGMRVHSL